MAEKIITPKVTTTKTIKLNKDQTISIYKSKEQETQNILAKLKEIESLMIEISSGFFVYFLEIEYISL